MHAPNPRIPGAANLPASARGGQGSSAPVGVSGVTLAFVRGPKHCIEHGSLYCRFRVNGSLGILVWLQFPNEPDVC